jgi:hypothetical protein
MFEALAPFLAGDVALAFAAGVTLALLWAIY